MAQDQLPDEAIVIRGGLNARADVEEQAEDEFEENGRYAISCGADADMTLDELAMANQRPNRLIRKSTVGRLRAAGFDVMPPTGPTRHSDLLFPGPVTDELFAAFEDAFDDAEPNPYYYAQQGGELQ